MSIFNWFKRSKKVEFTLPPPLGLYVKLVDLPGYREWAAEYDRLERIIPGLENFHLRVLPADVKQPSAGYFESLFQGHLDSVRDHFAHLNLPRHIIADYKRGGKFFKNYV